MTDETAAPDPEDRTAQVRPLSFSGDGWLSVMFGICLSGGVYPVIPSVVLWSFFAFADAFSGMPSSSTLFIEEIAKVALASFQIACTSFVFAGIGTAWAAIVSAIVVPVFYWFTRSMRLQASIIWLGAICGGLVGFVAVLPFWLVIGLASGVQNQLAVEFLLAALFGPCITTVLGQIGGALGGAKFLQREALLAGASAPTVECHDDEPLLRFQIRHLLWITVWLALLLTLIRLSGIPFEFILPTLVGWLAYQSATLYVGWLMVRGFQRWRRRRAVAASD